MEIHDVKQGDKIRVEYTNGLVVEGPAIAKISYGYGEKGGFYWKTVNDVCLCSTQDSEGTITLLERPKPAEPMNLGAVVRAVPVMGLDRHILLTFVRTPGIAPMWASNASRERHYWGELRDIEILHKGWSSEDS